MTIWADSVGKSPRVRKPNLSEVAQFGGLNLNADPQELGWSGAIDLLNVDFAADGRLRTRFGGENDRNIPAVGSEIPSNRAYLFSFDHLASNNELIMVRNGTTMPGPTAALYVHRVAATTSNIGSFSVTSSSVDVRSFMRFGTPTSELLFIGIGEGTTVRKYDGTTLTTSVGKGAYLAEMPNTNRVAQACFSSAADSPSGANGSLATVFFSDPGAPETYGANNYVHLDPGDGERITTMAAWGTYLFVFKQTKMYVFGAPNTDGSGNPVFDYREVALPTPIYGKANQLGRCVSGPDGLYFATMRGVYRTVGGPPVEVSAPIRPIFEEETNPVTNISNFGPMTWCQDKLVAIENQSGSSTYVWFYEPRTGSWVRHLYGTQIGNFCDFSSTGITPTMYYMGNDYLWFASSLMTDDDGTAIVSHYQTGFADLGQPGVEKILSELRLTGYGTIDVGTAINDSTAAPSTAKVTLEAKPTISHGRRRYSYRARNFSVRLGADSGAWSVSRMVALARGQRDLSLESS